MNCYIWISPLIVFIGVVANIIIFHVSRKDFLKSETRRNRFDTFSEIYNLLIKMNITHRKEDAIEAKFSVQKLLDIGDQKTKELAHQVLENYTKSSSSKYFYSSGNDTSGKVALENLISHLSSEIAKSLQYRES